MVKHGETKKFVVVHTAVDNWTQGEVIDREDLYVTDTQGKRIQDEKTKEPVDRMERLVKMGAIRPAVEGEEGLARVTLPPAGYSPAQALKLATLTATIDQLTLAVAAHEERVRSQQALQGIAATTAKTPEEDPGFDIQVKELEDRIETLTQRMQGAIAAGQKQTDALQKQSDEKQKAVPLPEGATGQAVPVSPEGAKPHRAKSPPAATPGGKP